MCIRDRDPDEFIKKFGAERFEMLLNGSNNAIEYELWQAKGKYDSATPDGRLNYSKDAIGVLAGRITPTERDVYAGRLAEETDVAKPAILNQQMCIRDSFMGGDQAMDDLKFLLEKVKAQGLKTCVYSGAEDVSIFKMCIRDSL